jgi:hypothetical protein
VNDRRECQSLFVNVDANFKFVASHNHNDELHLALQHNVEAFTREGRSSISRSRNSSLALVDGRREDDLNTFGL